MTVTTYSNARKNFRELIDKVNDDSEAVIITTKDKNAVLISEDEYNQYQETMYLLQSPANAQHLEKSLDSLKRNETVPLELDD